MITKLKFKEVLFIMLFFYKTWIKTIKTNKNIKININETILYKLKIQIFNQKKALNST